MQREVSRLLSEEEALGEVKVVKAYFGSPQLHIPRSVEKELGGGALLDIGVYCLQFVLMVFQGERPESIHATGHRLESGDSGERGALEGVSKFWARSDTLQYYITVLQILKKYT